MLKAEAIDSLSSSSSTIDVLDTSRVEKDGETGGQETGQEHSSCPYGFLLP